MLSWLRKKGKRDTAPAQQNPQVPAPQAPSAPATGASALVERASSAFYARNGATFWSLRDLGDGLLVMDDATFNHHTSDGRNDFASWAHDCIPGAQEIARSFLGRDRSELIRLIAHLHTKQSAKRQDETPAEHNKGERAAAPVPPVPAPVISQQTAPNAPQRASSLPLPALPTLPHHHARDHKQHHEHGQHGQHLFPPQHLHPRPLPPSPLEERREGKVHELLDSVHVVQMQSLTDRAGAREAFIQLRTRVWQELSEQERKNVLPKMRETYDALKVAA